MSGADAPAGPPRAAAPGPPLAAVAVDGGDLPLAGGLLALVRPALDGLAPGGVLAVLSDAASVAEDLPSWCRAERHVYLGRDALPDGRTVHRIARGPDGPPRGRSRARRAAAPPRRGAPRRRRARGGAVPAPRRPAAPASRRAAPASSPAGPSTRSTSSSGTASSPPETAQLYDQAVAATGTRRATCRGTAWPSLPAPRSSAPLAQVMTFLAENELSALYVPAHFLPRIHPAYAEVAMLLADARWRTRPATSTSSSSARARAARGSACPRSPPRARCSRLLELEDFTEAAFLLSVLGEGTFLDLLRFVEDHAPDEATAVLVARARADETRHVHFGLAHVRHALEHDPARLRPPRGRRAAPRRDDARRGEACPRPLQDALTVLAARGTSPAAIRTRPRRLPRAARHDGGEPREAPRRTRGSRREQARTLSDLHTPNFM